MHTHSPQHRSVTTGGTVYLVCACGASAIMKRGAESARAADWHACARCSTEVR